MRETDCLDVRNQTRVRTAIAIVRDCLFLDSIEEKRRAGIASDLCWLDWMLGKRIKITSKKVKRG
jgi:hypothetical protein